MQSGDIIMVTQLIRDYKKGKKVKGGRGLEKLGSESNREKERR